MKRKLALALLLLSAALLLVGCGAHKYTVTFDLNGGELVSGELKQTVKEGESPVLPEAVNGDKVLIWDNVPETVTADAVVTARWLGWYDVTFELNGGELISGKTEQRILEGESAVPPEVTNGKRALTWDGVWTDIRADTVIEAQWTKVAMDTVDLAEYTQDRTVTITVTTVDKDIATGSGFFIDDHGAIVTNYHVIDMAEAIEVETATNAKYPVKEIVDFDPLYDLAVLRLDLNDTAYLDIASAPVRTGEQVYAVGSALGVLKGSFTAGIVSSTRRSYGMIECIQTDTPISSGNSGGPLVNVYGDVVGINVASFSRGENLNLSIKPDTLKKLAMDKHFTVKQFAEWYRRESSRSWRPFNNESFVNSLVNTYQEVTGAACLRSVDVGELTNWEVISLEDGYSAGHLCYMYEYSSREYDDYVSYLKSVGFTFYDSVPDGTDGVNYYYYNEKDGILLKMYVFTDSSEVWIWPMMM